MLDIPENAKREYYKDSVPKELIIPFNNVDWDVSGVNWYTGYVAYGYQATSLTTGKDVILYCNNDNWDTQLNSYVYKNYLDKADYVYISAKLTITAYTDLPTEMRFAAHFENSQGGYGGTSYSFNPHYFLDELTGDGLRIYTYIRKSYIDSQFRFTQLALYCPTATSIDITYGFGDLQVESSDTYYNFNTLFVHTGEVPALPYLGESIITQGLDPLNYITVGTDPIDDITNEDLVGNNFSLTESLCSEDNLKFGVCEASHISFSIADRNENFKDRIISPKYRVRNYDDPSSVNWINWYKGTYPSPGNTSVWDNTSDVHASTYYFNILQSNGLQPTNLTYINKFSWLAVRAKIKMTLEVVSGQAPDLVSFFLRHRSTTSTDPTPTDRVWYFKRDYGEHTTQFTLSELSDYVDCTFYLPLIGAVWQNYNYNLIQLLGICFDFRDFNNHRYTDPNYGVYHFNLSYKDVQVNISTGVFDPLAEYDPNDCLEYRGIDPAQYFYTDVPLGIFNITNIKKSRIHQLSKCEITAYDNLVKLEQNAYDWYTLYMFVNINSDQYNGRGAQFCRQIFSSYWNIISTLGLDKRKNHNETEILTKYYDEVSVDDDFTVTWTSTSAIYKRLSFVYVDIDVSNYTNKVFVVDIGHSYADDDFPSDILYSYPDPYFRGINNVAEILIEEDNNGRGFSVNNGDYFKLHDDCTTIRIRIPFEARNPSSSSNIFRLLHHISVKNVNYVFDLANAATRLLYYNYNTNELFTAESSITARDVVRSLLEVCGCFFKLDRYTGLPQFVYCIKSGLYPSETLYPSDTLYPRQGTSETLPTSTYINFQYEDYMVQNIGRIQIVKNTNSNEAKSVCEWEYVGNESAKNTYKIDDNIFYCNEAMIYDYDNMPEVAEMLENMYNRISNLSYVPHITSAIGLPFIECGDRIILLTETGGIESFIWHRNLKGIQALRDTFESEGEEYVEAVKDYGYKIWEG